MPAKSQKPPGPVTKKAYSPQPTGPFANRPLAPPVNGSHKWHDVLCLINTRTGEFALKSCWCSCAKCFDSARRRCICEHCDCHPLF
jgi:hypothetical protein